MKCSLVVQSYGREAEYSRGIFAIWSFFAHSDYSKGESQALLFTDNPEYFKPYLKGLPVVYRLLTTEKIKAMRGAIDFVHRVKIEIIAEAFQLIDGPLFYLDSDTCFIQNPNFVVRELNPRKVFMHQYEYRFEAMKAIPLPAGTPFHLFYDFVMGQAFRLTDGTTIEISSEQVSWNAGVIVLLPEHQKFLPDVLKLTDDFYPDTHHHGCEQYAFNIVLGKKLSMGTCPETVFHYWPVVQKTIADIFLSDKITRKWAQATVEQKRNDIKKWTLALPAFIASHSLMLRNNAVQYFHENNFKAAWPLAIRVLFRHPLDAKLWRDWLYHLKMNVLYLLKRV